MTMIRWVLRGYVECFEEDELLFVLDDVLYDPGHSESSIFHIPHCDTILVTVLPPLIVWPRVISEN